MNKEFKQKNLLEKIKYICSIPVKDDGKALNIIFALCLISIIGFSVHLYLYFTNFQAHLESTYQENSNMNIEFSQNESMEHIQSVLNSLAASTNKATTDNNYLNTTK